MPRRAACARCERPIQLGGGSLPPGQATCRACRTVRSRPFDHSKCGTTRGRDQHRRRGEPVCEPCREAWNESCGQRRKAAIARGWVRPDREPPATPRDAYRPDAECTKCGGAMSRAILTDPLCSRCRGDQPGRNIRISPANRRAIYDRDGWVCQLCTEPVDPMAATNSRWDATLDHIVPSSLGGDDSPENLRLAHRRCNAVRGARVSVEAA